MKQIYKNQGIYYFFVEEKHKKKKKEYLD